MRFPDAAATQVLETSPEALDNLSQTVVFSDILAKDAGTSVLAKLDALSSLVNHEARPEGRQPGEATIADSPEESEDLDDYVKQFMERMTGKKEEVILPAQPVQLLPTAAPADARQPARAPECSESLLRMRDLANASSRSAMHAHQCRQLSSDTLATFLPAAVASLASSGLAVVSAATGSAWWQAGSVVLLVSALALGWRFWTNSRQHLLGQV